MPLILGWLRMAGTGRLNGSGLILIWAAVWILLPPVTLVLSTVKTQNAKRMFRNARSKRSGV